MAHLYSLFDFYTPYGNFNFILVLVPKFPGSLNLSFHNLSIYQFSRKNPSLAQFISRIYKKIYYKNSRVFLGRYSLDKRRFCRERKYQEGNTSQLRQVFLCCDKVLRTKPAQEGFSIATQKTLSRHNILSLQH